MESSEPDTNTLLELAVNGVGEARERLFSRYRDQLRRMVSVRMDRRLTPRVDPSDVVQDALAEASRQLHEYQRSPHLPFYPWLRHIAWQRLIQLQREHVHSQKRSVRCEAQPGLTDLPDESADQLARRIIGQGTSPSERLIRREVIQRVKDAMSVMNRRDREILVLRHLEQLSVDETAAVLGVKPGTVKSRHFRAVQRLHTHLANR